MAVLLLGLPAPMAAHLRALRKARKIPSISAFVLQAAYRHHGSISPDTLCVTRHKVRNEQLCLFLSGALETLVAPYVAKRKANAFLREALERELVAYPLLVPGCDTGSATQP